MIYDDDDPSSTMFSVNQTSDTDNQHDFENNLTIEGVIMATLFMFDCSYYNSERSKF